VDNPENSTISAPRKGLALSPESVRKAAGRDLITFAIEVLDEQGQYARVAVERYGASEVRPSLLICDGLANALRFVLTRGATRLEDRQRDSKNPDQPAWASKLQHNADAEYARQFAEAIRSALLAAFNTGEPK
jgi:hypothetical protein